MTDSHEATHCPANVEPVGAQALLAINCIALEAGLLSTARFLDNIIHIAHHQFQHGTDRQVVEELKDPRCIEKMDLHMACLRLSTASLIEGYLKKLWLSFSDDERYHTKHPPLRIQELTQHNIGELLGIEGNVVLGSIDEDGTVHGSLHSEEEAPSEEAPSSGSIH